MNDQDISTILRSIHQERTGLADPRELRDRVRAIPATRRHRRLWLPALKGSVHSSIGIGRFAVAATILALVGGFLLVAQSPSRVTLTVPGAETEGLPPFTGPAGNGLIAFSRDGDILVGDPVTGKSEVIVDGEAYWRPVFSPDGTHIAFVRILGHSPEDACDVFVARADGSEERDITPKRGPVSCIESLVWAPDGRYLSVNEYLEPDYLLLDASGVADPVPLPLDTPFGTDVSFLRPPDGGRLLVWGGTPALGVVDLDGGDLVDLAESSGLAAMGYEGFADAAWSPDGSKIAVLADAGDERHLYVMEATGSFPRRLATIAWPDDWLGPSSSWSPDGTTIAVQNVALLEPGSRDGCPDLIDPDPCAEAMWITLIDVETGAERALDATHSPGTGDGSIWWWSWSPDGQAILLRREAHPRPAVVDIETDVSTELPWEVETFLNWQRVATD